MRNDILYGIGMLLAASGVQAHDGRVYNSIMCFYFTQAEMISIKL